MKKRIFALLVAVLMIATLIPSAFAADTPPVEVKVGATMQVRKSGTDADWTNSQKTLTMSTDDMNGTVDFRCELRTVTIRNTITEWYEYGETLINTIAGTNTTLKNTLRAHFNEWPVTGEFTVTIDLSKAGKLDVPTKYTDTTDADYAPMIGFNDEASDLFEETGRELSADGKILTIGIAIKDADNDGVPGIVEQKLYDGVKAGTYLRDHELNFTVEGVAMDKFTSTQTVEGKMEGTTSFQFGTDPSDDVVTFYTDEVRASLRRAGTGTGGTPSTPSTPDDKDDNEITFIVDGVEELDPIYEGDKIDEDDLPDPKKPGYTFDGWYTDPEMTEKVTGEVKIDGDTVLYGHWVSDTINTEDHFAYVIGYPDNTVRPERNITREEVAMIFYRLLRDDVRDDLRKTTNDFPDVEADRWSNTAISTMANGGYIVGYPDGTFGPERNITRAEFATMATRFASLMDDSGATFSDIDGHWSKSYVLKAATAGWIAGYPDGTFLPEQNITRAEAMTIINRVLVRSVDKDGLHEDTMFWIDMKGSEWYYYIVLEATNSHDYVRTEDGITEEWTAIVPNKTWD